MFGIHISSHVVFWLVNVSLATFVVSALVLPWLMTRLPDDYFLETDRAVRPSRARHGALYWSWRVLKNLFGAVLLLSGFVMLFTPGQGVLTMLAGLWLMDLPGKRRCELSLIRRPKVLASINWIRQKAGELPLRMPNESE